MRVVLYLALGNRRVDPRDHAQGFSLAGASRRAPIQFERVVRSASSQPSSVNSPTIEMAGTKSGAPNASGPDQNDIAGKSDPLTKWAMRAILLFITLASFSWLDTIKVSFPPSLPVPSLASS